MPLHLVGENIDKARSHYLAESGKLLKLHRGVYVDASDDIDATVLKHAVRIARYLYPAAYLSAASAVLLGVTPDGRLFLSGRRNQRTRLRSLEIVQNQTPSHPSLGSAIIDDGLGEFRADVSSLRLRFLESFRARSEHAASIDDAMRAAIATRLIEEYGSALQAANALWTLARENEWYREGERAERYLMQRPVLTQVRNEAALELTVAWPGEPIGHLLHDGFEWRWAPNDWNGPTLVRQTTPGKLPPFILSLLPEGWLESVLKNKDERTALRSGRRYMSNITIVERESELVTLPVDVLRTELKRFTNEGIFTGTYAGPGRSEITQSFESNLARLFENRETPRLSGVQIKAPMYLDDEGILVPATDKPFTHILKPAGSGGYEALPLVEWLALTLGRQSGLQVPAAAIIPMPDGMPPAFVIERFDIRKAVTDTRLLALEDMCSVLDLPTSAKYDGTIERVARAVRPLSTAPEQDVLIILKRALFAWLIADGDMHLKNMALLKIAEPGEKTFRSVRMAPLYDAVTTRIFPQLQHDRMALKLNGKDDRLRRDDFNALAKTAGLKATDADAAMDELLTNVRTALGGLKLPELPDYGLNGKVLMEQMLGIIKTRIDGLA